MAKFSLVFIFLWINISITSAVTKLVHVIPFYVNIYNERNRYPDFQYVNTNTFVQQDWESFQSKKELKGSFGKLNCLVSLQLELLNYHQKIVTICLFQDEFNKDLFEPVRINNF